jgi:hypothetical protein
MKRRRHVAEGVFVGGTEEEALFGQRGFLYFFNAVPMKLEKWNQHFCGFFDTS